MPKDFYTISTLFSLSGSAMAVWMITSVLGDLLGAKFGTGIKKWLGLLLSLLFSLLGLTLLPERNLLIWVVAIVNGFLIYLTAVGLNSVVAQPGSGDRKQRSPVRPTSGGERGGFTESWW